MSDQSLIGELVAQRRDQVDAVRPEVLAAKAALYHGEVAGRALTLQLRPTLRGYRLSEAKGTASEEPTDAQRRVVRRFVRHFGKGDRCGCGEKKTA
jgi:hypothetical protein